MRGLIRWFLRNPVAANLFMAALVAAGLAAAFTTTIRTFPEIAVEAVTVTVAYPGATPTEVADAIIVPIEEQLEGLEGVREISGSAEAGVAVVTAELTRGADPVSVKDDVETAVAQVTTFPEAAETPRIAEREEQELAVQFVLYGPVPVGTLKAQAERARDALIALPSVSQVEISGVPADLIEIAVDRETLRAYDIGLTELGARIAAQTLDLSGGGIDTGEVDLQVRTVGEAETADALREKILFAGENGARVALGDIATIRETLDETDIAATVSGQPAIFVSVFRADSEQVLSVADAALAYVEEELRPILAPGVEALIWRDEAQTLRGRINLLIKNGLIGTALILLVLTLFLDLRIAAWVAAGVVIAFIGAFSPMLVFGTTINQLSLFGFILALGIVVDDAIVVGENTYAELESGDDPEGAAERGVLRVWRPILFSVATTICAFVPLLFLPGSSGSFIAPIAAVVIYVLTVSLAESYLILPRHLSHVRLREPRRWSPRRATEWARDRVDRIFERFREGFVRRIVTGSVRHPVFALAACLAIAVASAGLLAGGVVRFVFFPSIEGNFVTAQLGLAEGTSEEETLRRADVFVRAAQAAAEEVGDPDLLEATSVAIGFAAGEGGGPTPGSTARIEAKLRDAGERDVSAEAFKTAWRDAVGEVPGARELLFSAEVVGVGSPIFLEIAAEEERVRDAATSRIREALEGRPGVFDVRDDSTSTAQEIALSLKPAAQVYGVSLEQLAQEVRSAFYGYPIDEIARDREEVDIRLRLVEEQRDSVADLLELRVPAPAPDGDADELPMGGSVPLTLLADISFRPAPTEIERIDGRYVVTLEADVDNAQTTGGTETSWVLQNVVPQLEEDYPGLRVVTGGEQEEAGRFGSALLFNFSLALFAIYAILALAFGSYFRPFIVLGVIPFGFVGALLGHALLGLNLTLLSMFGIIGLAGVIVNDALLIVDFVQEREAGGEAPRDAIVEATLSRFRPVILTTLTTFLGIAPLILETSVQAQFLVPTAVALGTGVLFASILQMVLVPAYAAVGVGAQEWLAGTSGRRGTA